MHYDLLVPESPAASRGTEIEEVPSLNRDKQFELVFLPGTARSVTDSNVLTNRVPSRHPAAKKEDAHLTDSVYGNG